MDSLSMSAVSGIESTNDATVSLKVRPFKCQYCSKDFDRYSHLARHLKIHSGLRPFECKYCHKSFSRSDNLIKHVRIHTGDKRYGCEFCLKRFTDSSNLSKHMRTHAGTQRYTCTLCSKAFRKSDILRRHLLTHGVSDGNSSTIAISEGNGSDSGGGGGGGSSIDNGIGEVTLRDDLSVRGHDRRLGSGADVGGDAVSLLSLSDAASAAADMQRRLQMQNILHIINKERTFPTTTTTTTTTTVTTAEVSNPQSAELPSQLRVHSQSRLPSASKSETNTRGILSTIGEPSNGARSLGPPDAEAAASKSSYTGNLLPWSSGDEDIGRAPPKNVSLPTATDVFCRTDHIMRQVSRTNESILVCNNNNTSSGGGGGNSNSNITRMKSKQNRTNSVNHVDFDFDQVLSYSANATTLLHNPVSQKASGSSRPAPSHSVDRLRCGNSLGRAHNRFPITFQCNYCSAQFFSRTLLEMHEKGHQDACAEEDDVAPIRIKKEYDDSNVEEVNPVNTLLENSSEDVSKIHIRRRQLESHGSMGSLQTSTVDGATSFEDRDAVSSGLPYKCLYCKAVFPRALALADHLKRHIRRRLECRNCRESFSSSVRLSKHRRQCPAQDRSRKTVQSKNNANPVQQRLLSARLGGGGQQQFDHCTMTQENQRPNPSHCLQLSALKLKQEIILSDSETEDNDKGDVIEDPGNSMSLQNGLDVLDNVVLSMEDLTRVSQNGEREAFNTLGMGKKKRWQANKHTTGSDFRSSLLNTACKEKASQEQQAEEEEEMGKLTAISGNDSAVEVDAIVAKILSNIGNVTGCDFRRVIKQEVEGPKIYRGRKRKEETVGDISIAGSLQNLMSVDQVSLSKPKNFSKNSMVLTDHNNNSDDDDDNVGASVVNRYSSVTVARGVVLKTETEEMLVSVADGVGGGGGDDSQAAGFSSARHLEEVSDSASPASEENFTVARPEQASASTASHPSTTPTQAAPMLSACRVTMDPEVEAAVKKEASVPPWDRSANHNDLMRTSPLHVHTVSSSGFRQGDNSGIGPLTKASGMKGTHDIEIVNSKTRTTTAPTTTITTTTATATTTTKYIDHDNNSYLSTSSCNSSSNNSCSSTTTATAVTTCSSGSSTAATCTSSTTASAAISTATSTAFNTTSTAVSIGSNSPGIPVSISATSNTAVSLTTTTTTAATTTHFSTANLSSSAASLTSSAAACDNDGSVRDNGNSKEFFCSYCKGSSSPSAPSLPVSFSSALELTQHLRWRHLVHACSVCLKHFSKSTQLNRHLKIHAGIKPFRCAYCDRAFSRSDNLVKHVRIHTGDKRYSCSVCTKRFTDSSNLTKHLRTHARAAAAAGSATASNKSNGGTCGSHSNSNQDHMGTGSGERDDNDDRGKHDGHRHSASEVSDHGSKGDDASGNYEHHSSLSRQQQQNQEQLESRPPLLSSSTESSPFQCMLCSRPFDDSTTLHRHLLTHAKLGQSLLQLKTLHQSGTTSLSPPPSRQLPSLPCSVPSSSATDSKSISAVVTRAAIDTTNITTTTTTTTTTATNSVIPPPSPPQSSSPLLSLSLQSVSSSAKTATSALKKTFGSGPTALLQRFKKQLRDKLHQCRQCGKVFLDEFTLANHVYRHHVTTVTAVSPTIRDGEENDEEVEEDNKQTGSLEHGQTAPVSSQQNTCSPMSFSREMSAETAFSKTGGASSLTMPDDPNCSLPCNVNPFVLDYIKQEVIEQDDDDDDDDGNQDEDARNTTLTLASGLKVEMETEMDEYLQSSNNNSNSSDRYDPHRHHNRLHPYINDTNDDDNNNNENNGSHQSQQHQQNCHTHHRLPNSDHHPRNCLFHCSRCQIFFSSMEELTHHLKLHTTGEMFRCKECGELSHDLNTFNDHLLGDCRGSSANNTNSFTNIVSLAGNALTSAVSHDERDSVIFDANSFDNVVSNSNNLTSGNDLIRSSSKANSIMSSIASDVENLTTTITNSDGSSNTSISLGHHNSISSLSKTEVLSSAVSENESLTNAAANTNGSSGTNITSVSHNLTEVTREDSVKLPLQNRSDRHHQSQARIEPSIVMPGEPSLLLSSSSSHLQFSSPLPLAPLSPPSTEFSPVGSGQEPGSEQTALVVPSLSSPNVWQQRQVETTGEIYRKPNDSHDRRNHGDDGSRTADGSNSLLGAPRNNMVATVDSTNTTTNVNNNNNDDNSEDNNNSNGTINDSNNNSSDFQESFTENFAEKPMVDPFRENLSLAVKQEFVLPDGSAVKQEPKTPEPEGQGDDGYCTSIASGSTMELFQWQGRDGSAPLTASLAAHVREAPQARGPFEAENSCGSVGGISRADIKEEVVSGEGSVVAVGEGQDIVIEDGNPSASEPFQRATANDNGELLAGTVALNTNFVFPSALDEEELKDINFKFPSAVDAAEELKNVDFKFSFSEKASDGIKDLNLKSQGDHLSYDLLNTTRNPKDAHHTDVAGFYSKADQESLDSYDAGNGNFQKDIATVTNKQQPEAEKCIQEFLLFDEFVKFRNKNYFSGGNGDPESALVADPKYKTNNVICISDSNSNSAMSLSDDDDDDDGDGDVPLTLDGPNYKGSAKNLGFTTTAVLAGFTSAHHADNAMMKQSEDLKDIFENVNVKLEEVEEMSQPCANDVLASSLPEGGFEIDNSNGDDCRANRFPQSQWEANQNDGQFRDAMLDFLSSLSDETLQLLLQKGDKWCDELLHHAVTTAAWKPAATTNTDCLPSDVVMAISASEVNEVDTYEDSNNHVSVDTTERKSQNLPNPVAANLTMANCPDNTSSYNNNNQCLQHDSNNTANDGNKQLSLMTAEMTPTASIAAVNSKELHQEIKTLKDNLSQPLSNSLSLLSCSQPADSNLDFPKPFIKVEPGLATDLDSSAMVPISTKIKTEDLSKFADAISNPDELASLLSSNQLPAQNSVREMLIERDMPLKSKHSTSRFLGNVFTDQLISDADRKVTFSELNDNQHELVSSLPLASFPSIPANEISYRSNSPSSVGQPFLLNSLNHTLNFATFADKGETANTSAINIIARNCGLQLDKPSCNADVMKHRWQQQQQQQQDRPTATAMMPTNHITPSTTTSLIEVLKRKQLQNQPNATTTMMPTDLIAPSMTTSLIKALQRKQQQLPRHGIAQSTVKQYTCPQYECRKMFTRPSHLKRHLKVHAGLKPFPCPHCHKWFSRSDNLTKHIRIHTGEKLFSCNFCQKRFSDSSNLTKHVRTHTGEKPYRCVYCSQTFTESRTLSRHMRTHSLMMMMMMEMDMVGGVAAAATGGDRVGRETQEAGYDIVVGSN